MSVAEKGNRQAGVARTLQDRLTAQHDTSVGAAEPDSA